MMLKTCLYMISFLAFIYWTEACDIGWFGAKCQYKCRCSWNSCNETGDCINGADCMAGWFGPACQFVDIASGKGIQSETTDGNDATCGRSDGTNIVTVMFDKPYPITWVRVHVRKSAAANKLNASLVLRDDSKTYTPTLKKSIVRETTVDIYIDTKWNSQVSKKFQEVRVLGLMLGDVCTVQISGGRNVALKQQTSQSSTYTEHSISYGPEKAVDGNTESDFYSGQSCTHTSDRQSKGEWSIKFSQPKIINRYLVYNRKAQLERLRGFTLQSYQANGTKVVDYINSPATTESVYSLSFPGLGNLVSLVNIEAKNNEFILTLCEVEIYGDSVCEDGKYGRDCEHRCNCSDGKPCFVSTGGCPASCPEGFFGDACEKLCTDGVSDANCNTMCSGFCLKKSYKEIYCDSTTGRCLHGCEEGYQGFNCTTPCKEGMYGENCNSTCSKFCRIEPSTETSCDKYDGLCLHGCVDGYQGVRCSTPCNPGMYGQDCMFKCSKFCLQKSSNESSCDHVSGRCLHGCMSGYEGLRCLSRSIMLTISGCFPT